MRITNLYVFNSLMLFAVISTCSANTSETETLNPQHPHSDPRHHKAAPLKSSHLHLQETEGVVKMKQNLISERIKELAKDRDALAQAGGNEIYTKPYNNSISALENLKANTAGKTKSQIETEIYHIQEENFPQDDEF